MFTHIQSCCLTGMCGGSASNPDSKWLGCAISMFTVPANRTRARWRAWYIISTDNSAVRVKFGCSRVPAATAEQRRDFVHVDDVCDVILWFIEHRDVSGIFNVGTGRAQTFNDVANAVIRWHGSGRIRYIPFPPHLQGVYQSYTQADLGELRNAGCNTEFRDVSAGVRDCLDALSAGQP